jgi:hypothetical protein
MILRPRDCGLERAEIRWSELRPTPDARDWRMKPLPAGNHKWKLSFQAFPGDDVENGFPEWAGTVRYAATIGLVEPGSGPSFLGSDGASRRAGWENPESAPGYRVTRSTGLTLDGYAAEFARLPVVERATAAHVRERVSCEPVDLVLGSYAAMRGKPLPGPRRASLDGEEWSWVFRPVYEEIRRRVDGTHPFVAAKGRGVPWRPRGTDHEERVRRGDVLLLDGTPTIVSGDDGDGWLDNEDTVVLVRDGAVVQGTLLGVPGEKVTLLRPRDFFPLGRSMLRAGYGPLKPTIYFGSDLEQALSEFQRDRELPITGRPDEATLDALGSFLSRLDAVDAETESDEK